MEETRVKKMYIDTNLGVFVKTRNKMKDGIKNRTNNGMKWNNHTIMLENTHFIAFRISICVTASRRFILPNLSINIPFFIPFHFPFRVLA
jgi:hypothetical protein